MVDRVHWFGKDFKQRSPRGAAQRARKSPGPNCSNCGGDLWVSETWGEYLRCSDCRTYYEQTENGLAVMSNSDMGRDEIWG